MRIGDVGHDHADQTRAAAPERLRGALRGIADFGDRPFDLGDDVVAGRRGAVDDRRHGRDRHARHLGDIPDGGHRGRLLDVQTAGSPNIETFRHQRPNAERCEANRSPEPGLPRATPRRTGNADNGRIIVKARLTGLIACCGLALGANAARADDVSANLRLMAFGRRCATDRSEARGRALQPATIRTSRSRSRSIRLPTAGATTSPTSCRSSTPATPTTSTERRSRPSAPSRRAASSSRSTTISRRTRATRTSTRRCSSIRPTKERPISFRSAGTTS